MTDNFENENWVHVDAYTKDDETQVREHWRRKYATGIPEPDKSYYKPDPFNRNGGDMLQEGIYMGIGNLVTSNGKLPMHF